MSPSTSSISVCACSHVSCYVGAHIYIYIYHTGRRPDPLHAAWLREGWAGGEAGKCSFSGAGKGTPAQQGCLGAQDRSDLSQSSSLVCLEVWLNPGGIFFPSACSLSTSFSSFSPRCFMFACHTSGPRGSPQLSFTPPAKVSHQRGAPTMPLLTLAVRHLPLPLLHPRRSGNSLIA